MLFKFARFILLLCVVVLIDAKEHFPKEFQKCKKDDPNLNECVRNAVQMAMPFIAKGLPKHGIMPADPLEVTKIEMIENMGLIKLNMTSYKIITIGNANNIIQKAEANYEKRSFSFTIFSPKLVMTGSYTMNATFFGYPIDGRGDFEFTWYNTTMKADIFGKPVMRNGFEYLKLSETLVNMDIGKIVFNFKNLKNANGKLGENINWFLNRHSDRIVKVLKSLTEETQGKLATEVSQPFFDRVPYNEMFI